MPPPTTYAHAEKHDGHCDNLPIGRSYQISILHVGADQDDPTSNPSPNANPLGKTKQKTHLKYAPLSAVYISHTHLYEYTDIPGTRSQPPSLIPYLAPK